MATNQVYEIKSGRNLIGGLAFGKATVSFYLAVMNSIDPQHRTWKTGWIYNPTSPMYTDSGQKFIVFLRQPGVILYFLEDQNNEGIKVPQPNTSSVVSVVASMMLSLILVGILVL
jgi:hypothetical protein